MKAPSARHSVPAVLPTAADVIPSLIADVEGKIVTIRDTHVILDADVAVLYGVETKRVNEAVRNNPDKFPAGYVFELDSDETNALRSKFSTLKPAGRGQHAKYNFKAFTERGLYMLATILKSARATAATLAIVETFAKVRALKRELVELHRETDRKQLAQKTRHFGQALTEIVMPDLDTVETESTLELNFVIGKIKHTVRRVKRRDPGKP